ncbi:MAG TPA: hypothetical protein VGR55_00635 [Candidatus Acidoferrum sp.]|nr:hypothetical protein [Candidatus Acidoferrum sp.]
MADQKASTPDQKADLKPQPVAVCTRCGAVSYSTEMINGQCAQITVGKRCTGVIGSAANQADWEICPACQASGQNGKMPCGQCDGTGWLYVRNRKR